MIKNQYQQFSKHKHIIKQLYEIFDLNKNLNYQVSCKNYKTVKMKNVHQILETHSKSDILRQLDKQDITHAVT